MPPELLYLLRILLAAILSLLIGAEREFFRKAAGVRTHTLVGSGSALFMVVSKYGFADVGTVDASRVAAQIVSGIGFLGAGLIFVRRDAVRGLTTAAGVWVVAAIGMAAGAGLYWVACGMVLLYLLFTWAIRPLVGRMPHARSAGRTTRVTYPDGRGILRTIMETIGSRGVVVADMQARGVVDTGGEDKGRRGENILQVEFQLVGSGTALDQVLRELNQLDGVAASEISEESWD